MASDGGGLWMVIAGKAMINFAVDVGTQVRMKIPAAIWGDPIEELLNHFFSRLDSMSQAAGAVQLCSVA